MKLEALLQIRLTELRSQAAQFVSIRDPTFPNESAKRMFFGERQAWAGGWLASVLAMVAAILPDPDAPHRRFIESIAGGGASGDFVRQVNEIRYILGVVETDLQHGLFGSIADAATSMAYGSFLDHAESHLNFEQIEVAGVIAGVAFEDAMRRLREKKKIQPDDIAIENLIAELEKLKVLSKIEGRRARVAAAIRTSAAHARWSEFKKRDVETCIHFTRQLIAEHIS